MDREQSKLQSRERIWVCGRVGVFSEAFPFSSSTDMQPQHMPLMVYRMIGETKSPSLKDSQKK